MRSTSSPGTRTRCRAKPGAGSRQSPAACRLRTRRASRTTRAAGRTPGVLVSEPWHLGMLCAFDTETTSADAETARLVSACIAYVDGAGKIPPESRGYLIDPGVDIPADAVAVHGITAEHAREHGEKPGPAVREIAGELLRAAAAGIPLIAFNAPFDLTVLDRETRRHGLEPFGPGLEAARGLVVDPYVLDKALDPCRRGRRTLAALAGHYGVK